MRRVMTVSVVLAVAAVAGSAQAQLASFAYNALGGNFSPTTPGNGTFLARAVDLPTLRTDGSFRRIAVPGGTADFFPGFVSATNPADIVLSLDLSSITATSAVGTGNIVITDVNGVTFSASVAGTWTVVGSGASTFSTFSGAMTAANFSPNSGLFVGDAGSFALPLPGAPLEGAVVTLSFTGANFLGSGFSGRTTNVIGQIVPTPGAVALLGLGGMLAARRRRQA